jgi:hypothetical protein
VSGINILLVVSTSDLFDETTCSRAGTCPSFVQDRKVVCWSAKGCASAGTTAGGCQAIGLNGPRQKNLDTAGCLASGRQREGRDEDHSPPPIFLQWARSSHLMLPCRKADPLFRGSPPRTHTLAPESGGLGRLETEVERPEADNDSTSRRCPAMMIVGSVMGSIRRGSGGSWLCRGTGEKKSVVFWTHAGCSRCP